MYEDSWYSFVPDIALSKKPTTASQPQARQRTESLAQQPNGNSKALEVPGSLENVYGDIESVHSPPEPTLTRRAASYSDFYRVVRDQLTKDGGSNKTKKTPPSSKDRAREALMLCAESSAIEALDVQGLGLIDPISDDAVLEASQREFLLYQDQLGLTERHLHGLSADGDAAVKLLTTLSNSFRSVEAQTSSFQAKCESLLTEQRRLEKLMDEVGTDLHYYAYLDTATRRLNAPGASRLVEDAAFGDMMENIDQCVRFMNDHESYRERDSYLARFNALLTKALYLLDHAFTGRLEKVSADITRQISATSSESARHALAYGRFEEMLSDSYSLLPNVQGAIRCAYDAYGRPVEESSVSDVYATSAATMFRTYLTTRDRCLKTMTQSQAEDFQKQIKSISVESACRNYIKQSFEKLHNEDGIFSRIFGIEPLWSSSTGSAFQAIKSVNASMPHPGNLGPLASSLQTALQGADLQSVCNLLGWLTSEYSIAESDEDESPTFKKLREYAARLLVDHLWSFADSAFIAEVTRSITKAPVQDGTLKIETVADSTSRPKTFPPVGRAIELLVMFDQAMPKERSSQNSTVVFSIIRETIQVLQRAEARIKTLKSGTDADLFMIQNLLLIKNELFSLEIGDIRSNQPQPLQHFGRIWDTLSPQNWVGFFGGILSGSLWTRGAPAVTAKTLTAEDMSEQLDELLRQSIYAFTKRWASLTNEAQSRAAGAKPPAKVEAELDGILTRAFHPEVVSKLKEAIRLNAEAQNQAKDAERGAKRY